MSDTVSRKSGSTTLTIGSVKTPVAIYKIIGDPSKARKWELANAAGEPWKAPKSGTADGELVAIPAGSEAGPLGEALPPAEQETEPEPEAASGENARAAEPSQVFEDAQIVYLAEADTSYEICGEAYVETPEYVGWTYDLQEIVPEDSDENKAGDITNGVQEGMIFARSPFPRKGIRKADGVFVDLTDAIAEITEKSTLEEMRVVSFIDTRHVPRERIISAYYLAGDSGGEGLPPTRLLATLMRAMRAKERVAVVRFSKRVGQTLGILTPRRDGSMLLLELAYAAQERKPSPTCLAANQVEPRSEDVAGAIELIEAMAGKRESLDSIRDPRLTMEMELIARAEAGELDDLELGSTLVEDDEVGQLGELLRAAAVA